MKKQLIAIGLLSFLAVPSVVLAEGDACAPAVSEGMTEEALMAAKAEMMGSSECMAQRLGSVESTSHGHGVSLYGSFRAGVGFGSGDSELLDLTSRWGMRGSTEVSEGLTASYRYEARFDITDATTAGHRHTNVSTAADTRNDNDQDTTGACEIGGDPDAGSADCQSVWAAPGLSGGGRLSFVSLSGGFGSVSLGQIWSASGTHYGFAVDPSVVGGAVFGFGGANYRNANSVSYSSSAGDVSFQIDKVLGDDELTEFGATAALGPIGVGLGYWKSNAEDNDSGFTGVALSAGAAGVNLTIGLGSSDDEDGVDSDTSILRVNGALGDSGIGYAVQIMNGDAEDDSGDQNFVMLTNSLGGGATLLFEHVDPGGAGDSSSLVGLMVDF